MDSISDDLAARVDVAWQGFTEALAVALTELPAEADLTIALDASATGDDDAVYDVMLGRDGERELYANAASNATLPKSARLTPEALAAMVALGWEPPGVVEAAGERFGLTIAADETAQLARIAVRSLREVYGAPHPAFLTYDQHAAGPDAAVELVLSPARPTEPIDEAKLDTLPNSDPGSLSDVVGTVVAAMTRTTLAHLPVDDRGEISIRSGSAMVFISTSERPAVVDVYSPLLTEVDPNERLYRELSELTRRLPIGRLYYVDGTIWASVPVYGRDFQPSHLMLAVESMTRLADDLDDRLQTKFGGRRFFDTQTDPKDYPPTGMYL